jgi:hypothetical protein
MLLYHCNLNPTQLVWSQVKGYIARHNKTFRIYDMFGLVTPALLQITSQSWQAVTGHVSKEEGRIWELDGLTDDMSDQLVINTGNAEVSSDKKPQCSDTIQIWKTSIPYPEATKLSLMQTNACINRYISFIL